ncbi:MAG: DUF1995 family protein [Thainema sp.]
MLLADETMTGLPKSIEEAVEQSKAATQAAIADGLTRIQVEYAIPELKIMPLARPFIALFEEKDWQFKVFFPDAGAAALARRDWGEPSYSVRGIGEIKGQIEEDDDAFLIIEPSAVEVKKVEKMYEAAENRPFVMLNPQLEDVAIIGIGYAGRQLRERFLSTIETVYCIKPLNGAAVFRCYPQPWQVWLENSPGNYDLIAEEAERPIGEVLDRILMGATGSSTNEASAEDSTGQKAAKPRRRGFLAELQQFLKALSQ